MGPVRRLWERERTRRLERRESWGGMGPVTKPGNRISCVSSVRFESAGDRVPARPGESERPVPSVRVETRSLDGEGVEGEQTMPAKEEQGSDEKSQVVKKRVPGRSMSELLMETNAAKSSGLSVGSCCADCIWTSEHRVQLRKITAAAAAVIFDRIGSIEVVKT
ncbi:hypothetical protein Droror1_Dr00010649 [Drosera rotundifolia]